jgi:hypothetical protein
MVRPGAAIALVIAKELALAHGTFLTASAIDQEKGHG